MGRVHQCPLARRSDGPTCRSCWCARTPQARTPRSETASPAMCPCFRQSNWLDDALHADRVAAMAQRVRLELPAHLTSLRRSRRFVSRLADGMGTCRTGSRSRRSSSRRSSRTFSQHTDGPAGVRLEADGTTVTVAVEDCSHEQASVREWPIATGRPTGLGIVGACAARGVIRRCRREKRSGRS